MTTHTTECGPLPAYADEPSPRLYEASDGLPGASQEACEGRPTARRKHMIGDSFASLTMVDYADSDRHGSRAVFECECGNRKTLSVRNVTQGRTVDCADRDRHPDRRRAGDRAQIGTWHRHINKVRGPASEHPCVACGAVGNNQWSYRHSSYEARAQLTGKNKRQVYSLDLRDYWSLCRGHHAAWDAAHRAVIQRGSLSLPHIALAAAFNPYDEE